MIRLAHTYTTPQGQRGVVYRTETGRAASFAPLELQGDSLRAWLSSSLQIEVADPHPRLAGLDDRRLERIVAATYRPSLHRMLAIGPDDIESISARTPGQLTIEVASSSTAKTWRVTLPDSATRRPSCSCPWATRHPRSICKHIGAAARLLLHHPDISAHKTRRLTVVDRFDSRLKIDCDVLVAREREHAVLLERCGVSVGWLDKREILCSARPTARRRRIDVAYLPGDSPRTHTSPGRPDTTRQAA